MLNGLKTVLAAGVIAAAGLAGAAGTAQAYDNDGYHHGKHHKTKHHHKRYKGHSYKRMMERFDSNDDNELTQAELDAARRELLGKHDADNSGTLTLEEFQTLWLEFMRRQMVRGFQRLDVNGDAVITADEFIEPFSEAITHMDRNDDGKLNSDDRRRGSRNHDNDQQNQ